MNRYALHALLIACTAGACASDPVEPRTPIEDSAPRPPSSPVALEDCPDDEAAWQNAVKAARDAGTLDAFASHAADVASSCPGLWAPRWAAGDALYLMRDREKLPLAREHYQAAMELARAAGSTVGIARCANTLAGFFVRERDYENAERIYTEGLDAARALARGDLEAFLLNNYARVLRETGRFAEAVQALQRARPLLIEQQLASAALSAGYNESVMLLDLGNTAEARDRLEEVFATATNENNARIMDNSSVALGNLHRLQNQTDTAREWFERVVDDDRRRFADLGMARLAVAEGDYDAAEENLEKILTESSIVGAMARTLQIEITLRRGDVKQATEMAERVVGESADAGGASTAFTSQAMLGKCLLALGDHEAEAIAALQLAVDRIEEQGQGLTADQEGVAYLRERAEPYADLAAALALNGSAPALVLDTIERAHSRALRRVLGNSPRIAGASQETVQAALSRDDVLLTYLIGQDRGAVVALTRERSLARPIEGWATLRPLIEDLRRALIRRVGRDSFESNADPTPALGARLHQALLAPVESLLAGATRVWIVPDQDLALVPFGALPANAHDPSEFLAQVVEIGMLPMAGAAPSWDEPRLPLLLAGDPLPDETGEFETLPTTRKELSSISALWRSRGSFGWLPGGCSDDAAISRLERGRLTAGNLLGADLSSFNTIHLATHAVASSLDPRRCAVILSGGERLPLDEIAALQLGPALVVLSACRTGEGEIIPGEGVVGLTWAFLHAGAKAVAASLWSVEDESTAELMLGFHEFMRKGHDPVAAMTRAQRKHMRNNPHPAFWSPFVVVVKPGVD